MFYEVQHTYTRTDVYQVEANSPEEALAASRAGEVECSDKLDSNPTKFEVFEIINGSGMADTPCLTETVTD
jgi:hypothetical protein